MKSTASTAILDKTPVTPMVVNAVRMTTADDDHTSCALEPAALVFATRSLVFSYSVVSNGSSVVAIVS